MGKKISPQDNAANMKNSNAGTSGVNKQFQQAQSNTAKQKSSPSPPPAKKK
jgi:hypothetical protein